MYRKRCEAPLRLCLKSIHSKTGPIQRLSIRKFCTFCRISFWGILNKILRFSPNSLNFYISYLFEYQNIKYQKMKISFHWNPNSGVAWKRTDLIGDSSTSLVSQVFESGRDVDLLGAPVDLVQHQVNQHIARTLVTPAATHNYDGTVFALVRLAHLPTTQHKT